MCRSIDIHTHVVPFGFPELPKGFENISWPAMEHDGCGHASVMLSGRFFRTVEQAAWDVGRRIEDMTAMGIGRQVVSPMPELLSYWLPAEAAMPLLRHVNAAIATMVAASSNRIIGMGAVPLQDVDLAIAEMCYAVEQLGLAGVEIGSNINGIPLGDPRFEPFFAAAEDLDVAIFVHAIRAAGKERLVGLPMLEQIVAFPGETGLAIAGLITSGTLARHPRLRIAFSHGGGSFPVLAARMQHFWETLPRFADTLPEAPAETGRRLYYDSALFNPHLVRLIADSFGVSQLLIGSDYPFGGYERDSHGLLRAAGFSEMEIEMIETSNALCYLGLIGSTERGA